ncbi:MAG: helix-turn-helix domain-containing protein [Reyranellaceae bacterium]
MPAATFDQNKIVELAERAATLAAELVLSRASLSPPAPPKRFLKTDEAAEYLSVSAPSLELWRTQGRGPAYTKMDKGVRYDVRDLDSFMAGEAGERGPRKIVAEG